ncbi:MAG: cupin domain-containing protein [Gammaproteobacteria bacterium]|nr:MAG: cupin domain-containing protein [Gammaproteobacteria bacterium]
MQPYVKKADFSNEYYFGEGCYITELSNSDDDPGLSIARARVEPGVTTQLHELIGTVERYVILEGEGLIDVGNLSPQAIRPCDVVIIPSGCMQKISNTGASDLIFLAICSPRFQKSCFQEIVEPTL